MSAGYRPTDAAKLAYTIAEAVQASGFSRAIIARVAP